MAKTQEDLDKSREFRQKVLEKYGEVPTSIWKISFKKNKLVCDPTIRQAEVAIKDPTLSKELNEAFGSSGRTVRGKNAGQSTLPYDMMERVVKFYSEPGETVLDPTMGDPTAMTVTYHLNRNFIGYDISKENFNINEQLKERLLGKGEQKTLINNDVFINIYNKSSGNMDDIESNSIDLIFFSPPYWDTEYYGEEKEQLGFGKSYKEFLVGLGNVINETYRVLKPEKYCAININDFRKNKQFYDFHMDVATLMKKAGYKRYDTIIIVWPNCIGQCFARQVESRKVCAKQHEYILIGKK